MSTSVNSKTPSGTDLCGLLHTASVPVSSSVHLSLVYLDGPVSLVSSVPSGSYTFSMSSVAESPRPEGRDLMETPLRIESSNIFHFLHVISLWVSIDNLEVISVTPSITRVD